MNTQAEIGRRKRWYVPRSFFAYSATSVATAGVELALLHTALAVRIVSPVAVSIGFLGAALFQFCVLRYVVFKVTHRPVAFQANAFAVSAILSWWLVVATVTMLTMLFPLTTMQARVITIPALFPINYLISRYVIFRK